MRKPIYQEKFERQHDAETKLIYSIIVAGKSANFADRVTRQFLRAIGALPESKNLPFRQLVTMTAIHIEGCARGAKTGNYGKLATALFELSRWLYNPVMTLTHVLNLWTCTPGDLEQVHGIGRKTSRFFIMWIRPNEEFAALDVHVLRWMRNLGYDAPLVTPGNAKRYEILEKQFIAEARKQNKTARELDMEIWEAGAGRTQRTALP